MRNKNIAKISRHRRTPPPKKNTLEKPQESPVIRAYIAYLRRALMSSSKEKGLSVGPKRLIGTPAASQRNLQERAVDRESC